MLIDQTVPSIATSGGAQQTCETPGAATVAQNPGGEAQYRENHGDNSESAGRCGEDGNRRGEKNAGHAAPPTRPRRAEGAPQRCGQEPLPRHTGGETLSLEVAGSSRQGSAEFDCPTIAPDSRHADVLPGFDTPPPPVDAPRPGRLPQCERDQLSIASGIHPATRMTLANNGKTCGECSFLRAKHAGAGKWWKCGTPDRRTTAATAAT